MSAVFVGLRLERLGASKATGCLRVEGLLGTPISLYLQAGRLIACRSERWQDELVELAGDRGLLEPSAHGVRKEGSCPLAPIVERGELDERLAERARRDLFFSTAVGACFGRASSWEARQAVFPLGIRVDVAIDKVLQSAERVRATLGSSPEWRSLSLLSAPADAPREARRLLNALQFGPQTISMLAGNWSGSSGRLLLQLSWMVEREWLEVASGTANSRRRRSPLGGQQAKGASPPDLPDLSMGPSGGGWPTMKRPTDS